MNYYSINEKEKITKTKTKDKFKNLKSDFFLRKLFNNLQKNKFLDIVKYNKKIQKRLKININDYKEYLEIYSPIEIEIIPVFNKHGQFININKEDEKYFHIYFNGNKKEIKRNYLNKDDIVTTIKIIIDYQVKAFCYLFFSCHCIESISFKKIYRNNIINMYGMFLRCTSLKELNLNNFNTNKITDMFSIFRGCSSLKELNLNNFNTNNVINMSYLFEGCSSLEKINLSNFNTSNVTDMNSMFYGCSCLKELNINNFDTNNVI